MLFFTAFHAYNMFIWCLFSLTLFLVNPWWDRHDCDWTPATAPHIHSQCGKYHTTLHVSKTATGQPYLWGSIVQCRSDPTNHAVEPMYLATTVPDFRAPRPPSASNCEGFSPTKPIASH